MAGADAAMGDMLHHFWDPAGAVPHIRPTSGNGTVNDAARYPVFWQMAEVNNLLYWQWRRTRAPAWRAMVRSQFAYLRATFPDARLSDAGQPYGPASIINVSDDTALAIAYMMQVHDATGDPAALRFLQGLVDTTYRVFADPNRGGAGILYALPTQDPAHQGVSQGIEALTARGALYVYQHTGQAAYLDRARQTWAWQHQYLRHPSGVYFCELDLRPAVGGQPNPNLRKPVGFDRPGDVKRGGSVAYIGGTLAMGSLSVALYLETGGRQYLDEVNAIVAGMLRPDAFLRPGASVGQPGPVFVNDRDAWSDGTFFPAFVADALALDGVDADGRWRAALRGTALSIIAQRTPDGFYTPDWSGPEWDPAHKHQTWVAQAAAGGGEVLPQQMQTSAGSVAVLLAAAMAEGQGAQR